MNPIEKLKSEHQNILVGIELLEAAAYRIENGEPVSPDFFRKAIDFIRSYADRYHHAKEENILFVEMAQLGFSPEMGPVAVMLSEHDQGRGLIANLETANEKYAAGDMAATNEVIRNARNFGALLRQHIHKEDSVLYHMAERALGPDGINSMAADFEAVEMEKAGVEPKYLALLQELKGTMVLSRS